MSPPLPLPGADRIVGGLRVHVVLHGAASRRAAGTPRPPVLLLHGLADSSQLWADVARDLGHGREVVAPDLLGLGRSERPPGGAGRAPDDQARLLLALLDGLGHQRVVVAGHELGGAVAVALAARAPERVAALALMGTPLHRDVLPLRWHLPYLLPSAGLLPATRALAPAVRAVDPPAVEATWRLVTAAPPPVLVLWGAEDRVLQAPYGRRLAAETSGAVWVPVAGAGHRLPEQHPERVAEELAAFADEAVPA